MLKGVIKQCKKCHREFNASSEDKDVCPRCLKDEFASAAVIKDADLAEFAQEAKINTRRQMARVEKMNIGYASNSVFNFAGKLNFAFGVLLFLFCVGLFQVGDTAVTRLPIADQTIFSMSLCVVAAGLLMFSFRRHKALVSVFALSMLAVGYFLPAFSVSPESAHSNMAFVPGKDEKTKASADEESTVDAPLTDEELRSVYEIPRSRSRRTYAIYINESSPQVRSILQDTFARLFVANEVLVWECREGTLFAVLNVQNKDTGAVSRILSRIGDIVSSGRKGEGADDRTHVFMVRCDAAKLDDLKGLTQSPALLDPGAGDFIEQNLKELKHLDAARVEKASKRLLKYLDESNGECYFCQDICATLLEVLRQPWNTNMDVYKLLVETLVRYSDFLGDDQTSMNKQVQEITLEYFKNCCMHRNSLRKPVPLHVPEAVLDYLVKHVPDQLVDPIFDLWKEDIGTWYTEFNALKGRLEPRMLELLNDTSQENIARIRDILAYLDQYGSEAAVPYVKPLLNHSEKSIQWTAKKIISKYQSE